jgi:hypothetical protein
MKEVSMDALLQESQFRYISPEDKAFIVAFNAEMNRLGYDCGGKIGSGYCWGRHMIIYTKSGVKSKTVYARIYMRDTSILLRLFLNNVDKHHIFIRNAPAYIKEVFTGAYGDCKHDRDDGDGKCMFRKTYTLAGRLIEKCNGLTFEFHHPGVEKLGDYIALFTEFFPRKRVRQ